MVVCLIVLAILFNFQACYAIDLEVSGDKKVIIEGIERGFFAVSRLRGSCSDVSNFRDRIDKVSQQKDANTEGFQLGFNLEAWSMMDMCTNILKKQGHPYYQLAENWAMIYFSKMRELQKKLKIDDETLIEVRGLDPKTWKGKTHTYEGLKN